MATVDLGKIRFNWTGAYNNSTAYVANDVVSSGGNSYICILASTGNAVSNGTYWSLMAQAGTNGSNGADGTDVGTVITTQGDILYRDGSGLQSLAKGTASQQLAMNSGATAPEWITAGGGGAWNKINTAVATNNSSLIVTGIDGTYMTYAIVISDFRLASNDNTSFDLRLGNSSSMKTSGYSWRTLTLKHSVSGYHSRYSGNDSAMSLYGEDGVGNNTNEGYGGAVIYLHNARSSITWPHLSGTGSYTDHNPVGNGFIFSGCYKSLLTDLDRVQILGGGSNNYTMNSGRITLYGIAHA